MWAANGSNEVMLHILQAFGGPGRTALSLRADVLDVPGVRAGHEHRLGRPAAGPRTSPSTRARRWPRSPGTDPSVVLLASPNNPTGTALPIERGRGAAARTAAIGAVLVVDEAYAEFRRTGTPSAVTLLPSYPNLAVARTMSKAFALAGGRVGYLAASKQLVDALRIVRLPYHLSAVTQAVARAALRHSDELLGRVEQLRVERDETVDWLRALGLRAVDSDANFVLFGMFADRHAVWQSLLDDGVLIRETGPDGWLRVSIGTGAEMAAFRASLWRRRCLQRQDSGGSASTMSMRARPGSTGRPASRRSWSSSNIDGEGRADISTGVGFYDHMLNALAKHALLDLHVNTVGDLEIDAHHTVEDTAIGLGQALREALGDKRGIRRFGDATVPLDEALVHCTVDLSGRPYCVHTGEPDGQVYAIIGGDYAGSLTQHVFETLAFNAAICIHIRVLSGRDPHHIVEAQFKAFARALRAAAELDPRQPGIPSTKGAL